jgi:hypothetical protein
MNETIMENTEYYHAIKIKILKTINGCSAINSPIDAHLYIDADNGGGKTIAIEDPEHKLLIMKIHKVAYGTYSDNNIDYEFNGKDIWEVTSGKSICIAI